MSDPARLLASADATDLEKELLASWRDERPSGAAREETLAMLGLAAGTASAAGAATASIAPKAAYAGWVAFVKWTGVSVLAIGAGVAGVALATKHHAEPAPATPTIIAQTAPPIVTETPTSLPVAPIELPQETARRAPQAQKAVPAASTLADQVAALDRARLALDARDGSRARKLVDAYEAEYPGGAFTQEAELVRIEALLHDGNRPEAERAAKRFLAAYPKSPHAPRIHTLVDL